MLALMSKIIHIIKHPKKEDVINQCPQSALFLLSTRPDAVRTLAHTKLHTFHFASVPACWRRLYTDASILVAVNLIQEHLEGPEIKMESQTVEEQNRKDDEDWIDEVVQILDMALIMTGAEGREEMIETLIAALQDHVNEHQPRQAKRRKFEDAYPVDLEADNAVPVIRYPIGRVSNQSIDRFEKSNINNVAKGPTPIVFRDALTNWPAFHERPWSSPAYLMEKTFGGRRLIPVEVGKSYTEEGWGQSIITFKDFMHKYLLKEGDEGDVESGNGIGYLAQHDLFSQIPALRSDISVPIYCYTDPPRGPSAMRKAKLDEPLLNAWFGPAGTVSPLHTDPYHNILCQVVGRKYIRLYSPEEWRKLYPRGIEEGGINMSNTSRVSVEAAPDELKQKFPRFVGAPYLETILSEGESLYIPTGWWHYVRSLTVSFSVSFWWN